MTAKVSEETANNYVSMKLKQLAAELLTRPLFGRLWLVAASREASEPRDIACGGSVTTEKIFKKWS